jgi:hypothetical protein
MPVPYLQEAQQPMKTVIFRLLPCGDQLVAVVRPSGALDHTNYQALIAYGVAAPRAIVDLSEVASISSSGMVALYALAQYAAGHEPPDLDAGWATISAVANAAPRTQRLAVVAPHPALERLLDRPPLRHFLALYPTVDSALDADRSRPLHPRR